MFESNQRDDNCSQPSGVLQANWAGGLNICSVSPLLIDQINDGFPELVMQSVLFSPPQFPIGSY